jgi:hypothetical protein
MAFFRNRKQQFKRPVRCFHGAQFPQQRQNSRDAGQVVGTQNCRAIRPKDLVRIQADLFPQTGADCVQMGREQ